MTDKERFHAIMSFEKPDRVLYWEQGFWGGAVERWYSEGMPRKHGVSGDPAFGDTVRGPATPIAADDRLCFDVAEGSGLDKPTLKVPVNLYLSPPFAEETLDEESGFVTVRDEYGIVKRTPKQRSSIPRFLSWPVASPTDFERLAQERLDPSSPERFPRDWQQQVERLNAYDGVVGLGGYPCGFFGAPRYLMGEMALLMGFLDEPELVRRVVGHLADLWATLYDRVLSEVKVDCIHIWEDMSFKNGPLISPDLFLEFLVPAYRKVTDVAKSHGVTTVLVDTDGDCTRLLEHFLAGGVTGLYPFEVQAGMDVKAIREAFPRLQILGGIDKKELVGRERIDAELMRRIPGMIGRGGYIPMVDHQVPPHVSWEDYRYYRSRLADLAVS
jgi:uroporphyrinogen decarboxylase